MRKHHAIPLDVSVPDSSPVTLNELLRTLLAQGFAKINEHFRPLHELCELSTISYDYVGDIEDLEAMDWLSLHIGSPSSFRNLTSSSGLREKYDPFPCDKETVDLASLLYKDDTMILGYNFDEAYRTCIQDGLSSSPRAQL